MTTMTTNPIPALEGQFRAAFAVGLRVDYLVTATFIVLAVIGAALVLREPRHCAR